MPSLWGLTQNLSNQEQQPGFWAGSCQAARGEEKKDLDAWQLSVAEISQCPGGSLGRALTSRLFSCPYGTRQGTNSSNQAAVCSAGRPFIYLPSKPLFLTSAGPQDSCLPRPAPVAVGSVSNHRFLGTSMLKMGGSSPHRGTVGIAPSFACLFSPFSAHSPSHSSLGCPGFQWSRRVLAF